MLTSVSAALVWAEAILWLGFYKKLQAIWIWLVICFFMTILSSYLSNFVCVSVLFYSLSNYVSGLGLEQYYTITPHPPQLNILLRPHCVIKQWWEQKVQSVNQQDGKKSIGQHSHNATQLISTMSQFIRFQFVIFYVENMRLLQDGGDMPTPLLSMTDKSNTEETFPFVKSFPVHSRVLQWVALGMFLMFCWVVAVIMRKTSRGE